ncbi:MAG: hypothetical protein QXP66_01815 [Candidatus Aenigmatarchaeota archaeon]
MKITDIFDWKWLKEKLQNMPDYVKQAEADLSNLNDSDFALVVERPEGKKRRFPINTPSNAALSQEYFKDIYKTLSFTERSIAATNIKKALQKFDMDVSDEVNIYADESISSNKFVPEVKHPVGYLLEYGQAKLFPYADASDIEKYLQAYEEIMKELNAEEQAIFKKNLKDIVEKLGITVPAHLISELGLDKQRALGKLSEVWHKLSPEAKLRLLSKKAINKKLNLNKLATAIKLREALAGEHPLYNKKLSEIKKLIYQGDIVDALKSLMAYDSMVSPTASIIDDLLEDIEESVGNPLKEAILVNLPELAKYIDKETLLDLISNPEEIMDEFPQIKRIVLRIIKL